MVIREHPAFDAWSFDREAMIALGRRHAAAFASAEPFSHIVIDDLLGDRSHEIARAFPPASDPRWKRRDYAEQAGRLVQRTFDDLAPPLRCLIAELTGAAFLDFLGALANRRDLLADPHFTGAGLIATLRGGHLDVHIDFNRDSARHLDRVLSILYYAPIEWSPAWGGELELWDRTRTACVTRIEPRRDRLVVLAFGEDHWHGHPTPLACPDDAMRAVVAAHYYAAPPSTDDHAHGAIWSR